MTDLIHLDFAPEHGQPSGGRVVLATAVGFLFLMHLVIALVTYNALVFTALIGARKRSAYHRAQPVGR